MHELIRIYLIVLFNAWPLSSLCVFFQLSINAFDYNCHVDLIKLLKQEGELLRLRKARQKMSELFPLTEGWCASKTVLASDESVDSSSLSLCIICNWNHILLNPAEIWLDWLKDEIRVTEEEPNREKVYELFEKAVKDYICECITPLTLPFWFDIQSLQTITFNPVS